MENSIEDLISEDTLSRMNLVVLSGDSTFSKLVTISGLDITTYFRFADLSGADFRASDIRGYDFTGANLSGVFINSYTLIDETTILSRAVVEWIELNSEPIVEKMQAIQSAVGPNVRRNLLSELMTEYRSINHIRQFITISIKNAHSIDAFFDYVDALNDDLDIATRTAISEKFLELTTSRLKKPKHRKKLNSTFSISASYLLKYISASPNLVMRDLHDRFLTSDAPHEADRLKDAIQQVTNKKLF